MGMGNTISQYLAVAVACGMIGGFGGYYLSQSNGFKTREDVSAQFAKVSIDSELVPISGSPVRGSSQPKVVVTVFTDFASSGAKLVHHKMLEKGFKTHDNEVAVVYKAFPIHSDQNSVMRAQAAFAAHLQGRFWDMTDALLSREDTIDKTVAIKIAQELNLDVAKFEKDFDSREVRNRIREDGNLCKKLGIKMTPTVFINSEKVEFGDGGAEGYFMSALNAEIQRVQRMLADPNFYYFAATEWNMHYHGQEHAAAPADKKAANDREAAPDDSQRVFVDISGTPALGNPEAPISIVEFSDFECPFCSRANTALHDLMAQYPDKIRVYFKHFPLPIHDHAVSAHLAAEAASLMGKFWEMQDVLFANQRNLERADLERYAAQIGLDVEQFKVLMDSDNTRNRISADMNQAGSLSISSTPSIFINGRRLKGAATVEKLKPIIDAELNIADKYLKSGTPADALYKAIIAGEKTADPVVEPEIPAAPIVLSAGNSYAKGPENAPVIIYQFSEFQCPFCQKVEPTIKELEQIYGDRIRIVFKNYPLDFHKDAKGASEAALAAGAQGKFWEMHEILFKNQKNLSRAALSEYAKWAGLDVAQFEADLNSNKYADQLNVEIAEGRRAGISGTPSFVINGKLVVGAKSLDAFKQEIDAALNAVKQ